MRVGRWAAVGRNKTEPASSNDTTERRPYSIALSGSPPGKTNSLKANPNNPRVFFDEARLQTLEASIRKVGVLMHLTIYQAAGGKNYIILDGAIAGKKLSLAQF